jgi:hypothetical protein
MAVSPTVIPSNTAAPQNTLQYIRNFNLTVAQSNFNGIDLSRLHCKFAIKQSSNQTPNGADITVYNVEQNTALAIQQQKFSSVLVQGGYNSNYGVVFRGTIKQVILGRESATDTFLKLNCGDGDLAYNFAIVNTTIKAGSSQGDQFGQVAAPMKALGLTQAPASTQPQFNSMILPRGKVLWGNSKDYMRTIAKQNGLTWSIQNEQIGFIHQQGYAPGETIVLNSKTGMIGTPQQTNIGVNVVCLMNPNIQPGRTIRIDNASVAALQIDLGNPKDPVNLAPPLNADGVYYVLVVETTGDTRGPDWYSKLICCSVKPAAIPINSVPVSYGP